MTSRERKVLFHLITEAMLFWTLVSFCSAATHEELTRFGVPEGTVKFVGEYATAYDGRTRCPRWTIEYLEYREKKHDHAPRKNKFFEDESIPKEIRATLGCYRNSGFDRGHMVPYADAETEEGRAATCLLSNVCPQVPILNQGWWKRLEMFVRPGTAECVWIVTIPLFVTEGERIRIKKIGEKDVWVPTHFAKAILKKFDAPSLPHYYTMAWIVPNSEDVEADANFSEYAVSVHEVEEKSGLILWDKLAPEVQEKLKESSHIETQPGEES